MDTSPEKYIDRLIDILKKKQVLLGDILSLSQAQSSTINEDSIEKLQKLIDKKQTVIDDINALDDEFKVYFNRLKTSQKISSLDELDASGVNGAKELKALTGDIMKLITSIAEIEKSNSEKSQALLNQLGGEIKKINQGKRINNAYTPVQPKPPSYFIDKKK